jgi:hypothetical protein
MLAAVEKAAMTAVVPDHEQAPRKPAAGIARRHWQITSALPRSPDICCLLVARSVKLPQILDIAGE